MAESGRPKLSKEQHRVRALFDSDRGRQVLEDWRKMFARPRRADVNETFLMLGKQEFVEDIQNLIDYKEQT